jgi:hypothetical protein
MGAAHQQSLSWPIIHWGGPQLIGKIVLTVEWAWHFRRSKIRLIRSRYRGLLSREVAVWVFGADHFRPIAEWALR